MDTDFTYYYSTSGTTIEIDCYYVNNTDNIITVSSSKDVKFPILHVLIVCISTRLYHGSINS